MGVAILFRQMPCWRTCPWTVCFFSFRNRSVGIVLQRLQGSLGLPLAPSGPWVSLWRGPFLPAWNPCRSPQLLPRRWWCWSPQATKSWRGRGVWETSFMPLMVVFVVYSLSHDQLFVTPWILPPWDFPDKNTGMGWHFLRQGISPNRDQTHVSCIARKILYHWAPGKANATGASLQIFFFFFN